MSRIVGPSVIRRKSSDAGYLLVARNWRRAGVCRAAARCAASPHGQRLAAVATLAHDLHVVVRLEELPDSASRERLIVYDQRTNHVRESGIGNREPDDGTATVAGADTGVVGQSTEWNSDRGERSALRRRMRAE
jgi:hypothetical protein